MKTWALSAFFVSALALAAHADVAVSGGRTDFLAVSHSAAAQKLTLTAPVFEIDGCAVTASVDRLDRVKGPTRLGNGVDESVWAGVLKDFPSARIAVTVRESPLTPVARFKYELSAAPGSSFRLTKKSGRDAIVYGTCGVSRWAKARTEVRFGEYDSLSHAYRPSEHDMPQRAFENSIAFQGPFLSFVGEDSAALLAYEHGSQAPDTYLEFACAQDETVALRAVKGNYPANRVVTEENPFESVWFQAAVVKGGADELAAAYRDFQLKRCTVNVGSRKPYVFYNTWASQERDKWWDKSGDFMRLMNEKRILEDVDIAHELGVDVFVVDVSWFKQTGDWIVDEKRFPHGLGVVRERLRKHGMKMGLWFNPTEAAKNSAMMARNRRSVMSFRGEESREHSVWSTPGSQNICVVSPYWKDFADRLIEIARELDVTYFKWDGISQFGCDSPDHDHGDATTTSADRHDCYSFEQVRYLCKIVDRICDAIPGAIVDFDVTEGGRCVGLAFLSSGKYFATNNGPYYPHIDVPYDWDTSDTWSNVFVYPGPARAWICRASLDYDRWIPSVLFLCHFLPDAPRESELINLGSLMLGPNGIWGNLQCVPPEGRRLFGEALAAYKHVRDDITAASPVRIGRIGSSPEIHEKIAPNGNGLFVMFANEGGDHVYVTEHSVAPVLWKSDGVAVEKDAKGRAVLRCHFEKASAVIVVFGDFGNTRKVPES